MQRLYSIVLMLVMLGTGLFIGNAMTPGARADTDDTVRTQPYYPGGGYSAPGVPLYSSYGYVYPPRWQIVPIMTPDARGRVITLLIDTQNGDTFYLDTSGARFYWARITR